MTLSSLLPISISRSCGLYFSIFSDESDHPLPPSLPHTAAFGGFLWNPSCTISSLLSAQQPDSTRNVLSLSRTFLHTFLISTSETEANSQTSAHSTPATLAPLLFLMPFSSQGLCPHCSSAWTRFPRCACGSLTSDL